VASGVFYAPEQLKKRLKKYSIYVIRSSRADGSLMNSRPCENCIDLMRKVGLKTVYYSSGDASIIKENVENMKQDHTSFGFKYINHLMYPSRYKDPKLERHEEQTEISNEKKKEEWLKKFRKNGGRTV
jgi:hypothetical protein